MTPESAYRASFEKLLQDMLNLSALDAEIAACSAARPMRESRKSPYAKMSSLGLDYVYLRNDMYLDNLSEEDAARLHEAVLAGDAAALDQLVRDTWKTAIEVRFDGIEGDFLLTYYPDGTSASNKAVVLEVAAEVNDFDENGMFLTTGEEASAREEAIAAVLNSHTEEYSKLLGAEVVFFLDC